MRVKVKFQDILHKTARATLFLMKGTQEVWVPNVFINYARNGQYLLLPKFFADEKNLDYKVYLHIPEHIEPMYKQEADHELIFRTDGSNKEVA